MPISYDLTDVSICQLQLKNHNLWSPFSWPSCQEVLDWITMCWHRNYELSLTTIQIIINSTEQIFLFFICFFSFCSGLVRLVRLSAEGPFCTSKHILNLVVKSWNPIFLSIKWDIIMPWKKLPNIIPLQPPVFGLLKIVLLQLLKEGDFRGILIDWNI